MRTHVVNLKLPPSRLTRLPRWRHRHDMVDAARLPDPMQIALAYAQPHHRPAWQTLFELDTHLGSLTAQAREPLLAQLRLAWWRDALADPATAEATGEPLLSAAGSHLSGAGAALSGLASAWELLLGEAPLPPTQLAAFCAARSAAYSAMAGVTGAPGSGADAALAGAWWVAGDTSARLSDGQERAAVAEWSDALAAPPRLPRSLRPLAILAALSERALRRREGVLEGRASALVALRVGLFGR